MRCFRVIMPRISQVVYCISNNRGLPFTLPCLSKTESLYVRYQYQALTEHSPSLGRGPGQRFAAIAEAYGLNSDANKGFHKICDRATHEKRFHNKIA